MKSLALIFVGLALYGVYVMHMGAVLLALFMVGLVLYASYRFDKMDRQWERDPKRLLKPESTELCLSKHECECS